jgi:hypothetical protein
MIDTAKLQAAQEAARAARAALLVALSESSAVEALHLTPLIAKAATLETEIRRLAQAVQEDAGATT